MTGLSQAPSLSYRLHYVMMNLKLMNRYKGKEEWKHDIMLYGDTVDERKCYLLGSLGITRNHQESPGITIPGGSWFYSYQHWTTEGHKICPNSIWSTLFIGKRISFWTRTLWLEACSITGEKNILLVFVRRKVNKLVLFMFNRKYGKGTRRVCQSIHPHFFLALRRVNPQMR